MIRITERALEDAKRVAAAKCRYEAAQGRCVWTKNPYPLGTAEYFGWASEAEEHFNAHMAEQIREAV